MLGARLAIVLPAKFSTGREFITPVVQAGPELLVRWLPLPLLSFQRNTVLPLAVTGVVPPESCHRVDVSAASYQFTKLDPRPKGFQRFGLICGVALASLVLALAA